MTRTQQITLGYYCTVCGADGDFNTNCTACQAEMIQAEYDRLTGLYFDQRREQEEDGMSYVDDFGEEF